MVTRAETRLIRRKSSDEVNALRLEVVDLEGRLDETHMMCQAEVQNAQERQRIAEEQMKTATDEVERLQKLQAESETLFESCRRDDARTITEVTRENAKLVREKTELCDIDRNRARQLYSTRVSFDLRLGSRAHTYILADRVRRVGYQVQRRNSAG